MTHYEVWGWDTFSGEDYFCGRFPSREAAEAECKRNEEKAQTQSKELRDTFSIVALADGEISGQKQRIEQIRDEKARNGMYSEENLANCFAQLLKLFKQSWEVMDAAEWRKKKQEERKMELKVDWQDETDCFDGVLFRTYYFDDGRLVIGVGVSVHSFDGEEHGGISSTSSFRGTFEEMLCWAGTEKALADCVEKGKELIKEFWED